MNRKTKTLFLDIGGILLTNGWESNFRRLAMAKFNIDEKQNNERHQLAFDTYELGRISVDEYLDIAVFYEKRNFSKEEYQELIYSQSQALPGAIEYFMELKKKNNLKVFALSNEAKEINEYRIKRFNLNQLFDGYISSCYVGMRKPDPNIFKIAYDVTQTAQDEALYIDDRLTFIEVASRLRIPAFHYQSLEGAKKYFEETGLSIK